MIAGTAIVAVLVFLLAFWRLGVVQAAGRAIALSQGAMQTLRNPDLDDRARETALQRASFRLMGSFGSILLRGVGAFLVSLAPIWAADAAQVADASEVTELLSRWDVLLGGTVLITVLYLAWRRLGPPR